MQSYKSWGNPAKAASILSNFFSALRVGMFLLIFLLSGPISGDNEKWIPYTSRKHFDMGGDTGFSKNIYDHLFFDQKLTGSELQVEFGRWNAINLGHVFEEAALKAYGIAKNHQMFNGRIPDGVENGILDQVAQYTQYQNSTFVEIKYMNQISLSDNRISNQLIDMIDYLSHQENHVTVSRSILSSLAPNPSKASEEGLAVLLLITPSNCIIDVDVIDYAEAQQVKIYQMTPSYNLFNPFEIQLNEPQAVTSASRHFFGRTFLSKKIIVNWNKPIIDPDSGNPINRN